MNVCFGGMLVRDEMIVKGLAARDSRATLDGRLLVGLPASTAEGVLLCDRSVRR